MSESLPTEVSVKEQIDEVFSIANTLRGTYKSDKYQDVIIPMTILRRIECALEPTRDKVKNLADTNPNTPDAVLKKASGYPFYNRGGWTLKRLLAQPAHLPKFLNNYIDDFSPDIKQVFKDLDFKSQIEKMDKGAKLTGVVRKFSELDLDPTNVPNHAMGYMFEEIIRRFSENAEAGDHFTPREVVKLLTRLALSEGCDDLFTPGKVVKVGDFACGTGGMLSEAYAEIKSECKDTDIYLYGQEVNPESHAICLADMLIKGQRADNIRQADTMGKMKEGHITEGDCFPDDKMRLVVMNPPFGQAWGGKDASAGVEKAVREEAKKPYGRFPAGLPATGDMQLLFAQHVMYKLQEPDRDKGIPGGRACIISNGSPLFSGGTTSGESQIRRWLLEHDYVEAIIGLTGELFYNTGISIYVWVLSKDKDARRKNKVQLIDATGVWSPMRRSLGNKRRYISDEQIDEIVKLYEEFDTADDSRVRVFPTTEFLYKEYTVKQPMQRSYRICDERIDAMVANKFIVGNARTVGMHDLAKMEELRAIDPADRTDSQQAQLDAMLRSEPVFEQMVSILRDNVSDKVWYDWKVFGSHLKELFKDVPDYRDNETAAQRNAVIAKVMDAMSVMDKKAPLRRKRDGTIEYDDATKDSELVRLDEDVNDYMEREVLPYVPDAKWFDEETVKAIKTGAEFPFTRYFYKFEEPEPSDQLLGRFFELEDELDDVLKELK